MFPPPNKHPPTSSSVKFIGSRDPASTLDFQRRVKEKGAIDLTSDKANTINRDGDRFSVPQGKRQKQGVARTECVSDHATTMEERWNQGTFRWVHKGVCANHPVVAVVLALHPELIGSVNYAELCVLKEFKTGTVYEEHFFDKDIHAVNKANEIIAAFNRYNIAINEQSQPPPFDPFLSIQPPSLTEPPRKIIYLTQPTVWKRTFPDASGRTAKMLVEPMLEGEFLKFNSNSGYTRGADFMQALSHFSYHYTNGQYLLCDLQGGHYSDCYILTDPVIMSADNSKTFGSGDLGKEGIENFFAHHQCNAFCHREWHKPAKPQASKRIPCSKSTTLSLTLGTAKSDAERLNTLNAILKKEPR